MLLVEVATVCGEPTLNYGVFDSEERMARALRVFEESMRRAQIEVLYAETVATPEIGEVCVLGGKAYAQRSRTQGVVLRTARGHCLYLEGVDKVQCVHIADEEIACDESAYTVLGLRIEDVPCHLAPDELYVRWENGLVFDSELESVRDVDVTFIVSGRGTPPQQGIVWAPPSGIPRFGYPTDHHPPDAVFCSWRDLREAFDHT